MAPNPTTIPSIARSPLPAMDFSRFLAMLAKDHGIGFQSQQPCRNPMTEFVHDHPKRTTQRERKESIHATRILPTVYGFDHHK